MFKQKVKVVQSKTTMVLLMHCALFFPLLLRLYNNPYPSITVIISKITFSHSSLSAQCTYKPKVHKDIVCTVLQIKLVIMDSITFEKQVRCQYDYINMAKFTYHIRLT